MCIKHYDVHKIILLNTLKYLSCSLFIKNDKKKKDIDLVCYSSRMRMRMERLRHVERECFY